MGDVVRLPWLRARCLANIPPRGQTAKVLRLPQPRGRLAWWVRRPGSTAHAAVWRPHPAQPGRWHWQIVCPHARAGWWHEATVERHCRTCESLIERARRRYGYQGPGPTGRAA
jgi:hypothetical protein